MLSILCTAILGLIVGFMARMLHPCKDSIGFFMTAILGVAGSFLAQYAGAALGWYKQGENAGFIASVVGAIVLLVIYGAVKGKTAAPSESA
jgi:uncharacterized membrane protein YeaQ/YmgE (transglycosylase-associated protein family)